MRKILSILFLIYLLTLQSCNQTGLGTVTAMKNLITAPYRGVKSAISNYQYGKIKTAKETLALKTQNPDKSISCKDNQGLGNLTIGNEQVSNINELFEASRDQVCNCKVWGSCNSSNCSCDILCPNNFDIFKRRTPIESNTSSENSIAFRTLEASQYAQTKGTNGYCWGHASITAKFNRLAFFNSNDLALRNGLFAPPNSKKAKKSLKYYKKIIDDIADNKVRSIPGFDNLEDFSSTPELQSYIAEKMAQDWADRAMTYQAVSVAFQDSPMPKSMSQELIEEIKTKIDNHQQPQIVFTKKGEKAITHTVLVSHYDKEPNGDIYLCIRDSSMDTLENKNCKNKMFINPNGNLEYSRSDFQELGEARLAHNDNADALEQFHALREHCANEKDCPLVD